MRSLAVIPFFLAVTPALGDTTKLAALLDPGALPAPRASVIKIGECFTMCSTGSARNDCAPGQTCSCYCDMSGRAVCETCR